MKILNAFLTVSGLAAAEDRKVPPRRPGQRLSTLRRFFKDYINSNVAEKRPDRVSNMYRGVDRLADSMRVSFEKCGFFDPSVPNGGPRPGSNVSEGRKRRDVDAEDPFDVYEQRLQDGERSASVRLAQDTSLAIRQVKYSAF